MITNQTTKQAENQETQTQDVARAQQDNSQSVEVTTETQDQSNQDQDQEVQYVYSNRIKKLLRKQSKKIAHEAIKWQNKLKHERQKQIRCVMQHKGIVGGIVLQDLLKRHYNKTTKLFNMKDLIPELNELIALHRQERIESGKRKPTTGRSSDRKRHKNLLNKGDSNANST